MNGIIIIDKEKNYTSRDVVNVISKKYKVRKIGHTGTLDPLATGVLVVCLGKATKLVEILTNDDKKYIVKVKLGIETSSLDLETEVLKETSAIYTKEQIEEVLYSFQGEYDQEVPLYSAVRVDGKKLYEYARNEEEVKLPSRIVKIKQIQLIGKIETEDDKTIFSFEVEVSKGTYIRSLVRDIAAKLGTIGVMTELKRVKQGNFTINDAIKLCELPEEPKIIDITEVIPYKKIMIDGELKFKVMNGSKIENIYNEDIIYFVDKMDYPIGIYKKCEKDYKLIKPWKMF